MVRQSNMDEPILKVHWERFKAHVDLDIHTATNLLSPCTKEGIDRLFLLSEGCANTNYKVTFKNGRPPVVIRIYMREKLALQREVSIHKLISDKIPVPVHLYADDRCSIYHYAYAIMEWVEGKLMREIILTKNKAAITECAYDAGKYLSELRKIKFSHGGFFEGNLQIRPFDKEEEYLPFVLNLLQDNIVKESLDIDLYHAVSELVTTYSDLLPNIPDNFFLSFVIPFIKEI